MSDAVYAAIVGAIVGGVISAITAFLVTRQQIKAAKDDIRAQIEASLREGRVLRTWEIASAAAKVQSEILSAYTPDRLTNVDEVYRLQEDWGKESRKLQLLGEEEVAQQLSKILNEYFRALRDFIEHKMKRGELEHRRQEANRAVASIMSKYR
jgi:hypothetical protein